MAQLQVIVVEARNLLKKDKFSENDPFVRLYLDDKRYGQKTKVIKNSKNPEWNQTIVFNHFVGQDLLHVNVYDDDKVRNEKIGSVQIDLKPLFSEGQIDRWFELQGKDKSTSCGEVHLILRYDRLKV